MKKINWDMFKAYNADTKVAFEMLSRILFKKKFVSENTVLRAVPNNPGVEVEPVKHRDNEKMISFQAKHFTDRVNYNDIYDSMIEAIKHYGNQLDLIYLYCNKDLSDRSGKYKETLALLKEANIELILITGDNLLDEVKENKALMYQFFSKNYIDHECIEKKLNYSLSVLGERYNWKFNIETDSERLLSIFLQDDFGAQYLNEKKNGLINKIKNDRYKYSSTRSFLAQIYEYLKSIKNIEPLTIQKSLSWRKDFEDVFREELKSLNAHKEELHSRFEQETDNNKREKLHNQILELTMLFSLIDEIGLNNQEHIMLSSQVMIITGKTGTGKTQMLANCAKRMVDNGECALLLLGQCFMNDEELLHQIMKQLDLNYSFEDFLDILNTLGEEKQRKVCVFFDAINESKNREIWKYGLPKIIDLIKNFPFVRIVVSIRTGYEKRVIADSVNNMISEQEICKIYHNGFFDQSPKSIQDFLNNYGVPFSPEYYLHTEWTNPLFLTLFCKVYDNKDKSLYELMDSVIEQADIDSKKMLRYESDKPLLLNFMNEFSEHLLSSNGFTILAAEVEDFDFWKKYQIQNQCYIEYLEKFGLIHLFNYDDEEYYYFAYDLLKDYICAKWIIKKYKGKEVLKDYLKNDFLGVKNGNITKDYNESIFAIICSLFAERYNEECIDILFDVNECEGYYQEYLNSYIWRKPRTINKDVFKKIANGNIGWDSFFKILIECALRHNHPLNIEFLHEFLMKMSLPDRDYYWTIFINDIYGNEHRISYIINYIHEKNDFSTKDVYVKEALIVLLTWTFSSSNRFVRDRASKAVVELLKDDFSFSHQLLSMFESVNDPYIIQRLYGVVFGACVKRKDKSEQVFCNIADYVYFTIFNKDVIYPDILLREYAKLIIERFIYEYPDKKIMFEGKKYLPPYNSDPIPKTNYNIDENLDHQSGLRRIVLSMIPESMNGTKYMYGDFGRYIFESGIHMFKNADVINCFNYAMYFIENVLGYKDEMFSDYDCFNSYRALERSLQKKAERIGKKYQWIAYFNILARLSDYSKVGYLSEPQPYNGTWQVGVRDFDPTINQFNLVNINATKFKSRTDYNSDFLLTDSTELMIEQWTKTKPSLYKDIINEMIILDEDSDTEWIVIYRHDDYTREVNDIEHIYLAFPKGTQKIWLFTQAYIVDEENVDTFVSKLLKYDTNELSRHNSMTGMYNREYYWSDSVMQQHLERDHYLILQKNGKIDWKDSLWSEKQLEDAEIMGSFIPAFESVSIGSQYDASLSNDNNEISFYVPAKEIVDYLKLDQKEYDGYYYDDKDILVAFDCDLLNDNHGLVIRRDYLERFLKNQQKTIIWYCIGEKQYFLGDHDQRWKRWKGIYSLKKGIIEGNIALLNEENNTVSYKENAYEKSENKDEFEEYFAFLEEYLGDNEENT